MAIDNPETAALEIKTNKRGIMERDVEEENRWPPWLKPLLKEKFFSLCEIHSDSHKGTECNVFCLDCVNGGLCSVCSSLHKGHHLIQIRRSSYHDCIRISDIQQHLDISSIQAYSINSYKVIFLNERPQTKPGNGKGCHMTDMCEVCERGLLNSVRFCSLGCMIVGKSKTFMKKLRVKRALEGSDSGNSYSNSSTSSHRQMSLSPTTPLVPPVKLRGAKRRKGIPRRAAMKDD